MSTHFILFVRDQACSTAFWSTVLDLRPRLDVPGMTELELPGGAILGLMPEAGIERLLHQRVRPSESDQPRAELYLVVDDLAAWWTRALSAGGVPLDPPTPRSWGATVGYLRDPDGHLLALAQA